MRRLFEREGPPMRDNPADPPADPRRMRRFFEREGLPMRDNPADPPADPRRMRGFCGLPTNTAPEKIATRSENP
jgi:hypothetical protein